MPLRLELTFSMPYNKLHVWLGTKMASTKRASIAPFFMSYTETYAAAHVSDHHRLTEPHNVKWC